MRSSRIVLCLVFVGLVGAGVFATPIAYISATTVPTAFSPTGGDFSKGVLTLDGTLDGERPLIIHSAGGSQSTIAGVEFNLVMPLKEDNSSGDLVKGKFQGGTLAIVDSSLNALLTGTITNAGIEEMPMTGTILITSGSLIITGGSLKPDFGPEGAMYSLSFTAQGVSIDDLTQGFDGFSDITIAPVVPEPLTMTLLGLGLAGLMAYRRKR